LASALALHRGEAEVLAWDDDLSARQAAEAAGLPLTDLYEADLEPVEMLVLSPGIPHTHPKPHPVVTRARAAGCEIVSDVELLARVRSEAEFIGVTGTNGKSTTTALIGYLLGNGDRSVAIGGNLGEPALALASLGAGGIYVVELSSYQLELLPSAVLDVAVLLNISPDHLDRHGGLDGYVSAKMRVFRGQKKPQTAVVGIDDTITRGIAEDLAAAGQQIVVPISGRQSAPGGVYVKDGWLVDDTRGHRERTINLAGIPTLPGSHNAQNAAAAYAAAAAVGMDRETAARRMSAYPGLAHRQELVDVVDGVLFVNDSKATNAEATARALDTYDKVYWIAGGRAKEGGIASLRQYFPRIRHAYLIGETGEAFAAELAGSAGTTVCGELARAVRQAHAQATADATPDGRMPVVLLSPACASFDQFANFEARGEAFRVAVMTLPGRHTDPASVPPSSYSGWLA
ncbi:MAG: UDP-N-acetylmuramoyl-L-alanine--D-glutamate ligase, partial [Thermoanaerobaculia bacterium]